MNNERLNRIYDKTNGCCHICHEKLTFSKYGASWEVEHSKPKARGGSDHLNNLYAAHKSCNREKGTMITRTARSYYGNTRAPYSKEKLNSIQTTHSVTGAIIGGIIGAFLGPEGIIIGAAIGGAIGSGSAPSK